MSSAYDRERKYINDWIREHGPWHICGSCMLVDCICGSKEPMLIGMASDAFHGKGDKPVTYLNSKPLAPPKMQSKQRDCPKCGCKGSLDMVVHKGVGFRWRCRDCGQYRDLYCSQESITKQMIADPTSRPPEAAILLDREMLVHHSEQFACPKCGLRVKVKDGKYGKFYGCVAFPRCLGARNMDGSIGGKHRTTETVVKFDYDAYERDALMMKEVNKRASEGDALAGALMALQAYAEPYVLNEEDQDLWT